jgi:uncharacterized protein
LACCFLPLRVASADTLARQRGLFTGRDYVGSVRMLTPLALRGNADAQALPGFMRENSLLSSESMGP